MNGSRPLNYIQYICTARSSSARLPLSYLPAPLHLVTRPCHGVLHVRVLYLLYMYIYHAICTYTLSISNGSPLAAAAGDR